jgi:hypothetical protein
LVACANTDFVHNGLDRVRFALPAAKIWAEPSSKTKRKTSNEQQLSAVKAGPMAIPELLNFSGIVYKVAAPKWSRRQEGNRSGRLLLGNCDMEAL